MIQSVIFDKKYFSHIDAVNWIYKHQLKILKFDETDNFFRFRQMDPLTKDELKEYKYATITIGKGVKFINIYKRD
jgi:hypothetical protein